MSQFSYNKIFNHLDRVAEWQKTTLSRPITYEVDMTNLCDSKCPFCFGYKDRVKKPYSLSFNDIKDILKQIKDFGGRGVTFTGGGEPLCNPDTIKGVKLAKKIGLDVGFITNGIALDKEKIAALVSSCVWIRVSLDAGSKKYYKISHGLDRQTFENVVSNIAGLVKEKRKNGADITIGTGFLTCSAMIPDMKNFIKISSDLGVDYAQFRPLLKSFSQKEINTVVDDRILDELNSGLNYSGNGFKVLYSKNKYEKMKKEFVGKNYQKCFGHHFAAVIAADKKMYLCCHKRGVKKYCLGDLSKQPLEIIWKSLRRREVYGRIDFGDCPLLCRCDGINEVLWDIIKKRKHKNFL